MHHAPQHQDAALEEMYRITMHDLNLYRALQEEMEKFLTAYLSSASSSANTQLPEVPRSNIQQEINSEELLARYRLAMVSAHAVAGLKTAHVPFTHALPSYVDHLSMMPHILLEKPLPSPKAVTGIILAGQIPENLYQLETDLYNLLSDIWDCYDPPAYTYKYWETNRRPDQLITQDPVASIADSSGFFVKVRAEARQACSSTTNAYEDQSMGRPGNHHHGTHWKEEKLMALVEKVKNSSSF